MNESPQSDFDNLEPALALRLNAVCERFEEAWRRGERPRIEDFLGEAVDQSYRHILARELVMLDLDYRRQAGETPQQDEYTLVVPEAGNSWLGRVVRRAASAGPAGTTDPILAGADGSDGEISLATPPETPAAEATTLSGPALGKTADPCATLDKDDPLATNASEENDRPTAHPSVGGYKILEKLGEGGMGVVYLARQLGLGRQVALKMILHAEHAGGERRRRFRQEAEAVASLQHPHIVQIYEVGEHRGLPYFSLEYCPGGSFEKKLQGTPLPVGEAAALLEKLARAVHAAHQKGIIHRDLKPANVLLSEDGTPKLTDFGLAKHLGSQVGHTASGAVLGTPSYMAPEQAEGKTTKVGPAADIYALGAILYECLTGRPPFKGATVMDTLNQVTADEPVLPSRLQPNLPRDLEIICLKCLQKEPSKRYASAESLADDLRRFRAREPILARPISPWERTVKWARRKPAVAAFVGASVLAACALVAFSVLYGVYKAQQADNYKGRLKRIEALDKARQRISHTLLLVQRHEAAGEWDGANIELANARAALDAWPDLQADELRAEVHSKLSFVGHSLEEQKRGKEAQERLEKFNTPYDEALFNYTLFTDMDKADSRGKARKEARSALALYGLEGEAVDGGPNFLERDQPYVSPKAHAQLAGRCYELLLIWAETEAAPLPGHAETEAQSRKRAEKGLALLARAARLGFETRTFHLRKGRYTARAKGEAFDPGVLDHTVPTRPTSGLDWFLQGLDLYRAGEQFPQARQACDKVLAKQENHFWARYVHALCDLQTRNWVDAKDHSALCMTSRPAFVWPRLLHALAASELGYQFTNTNTALAAAEFQVADKDFSLALEQGHDPLVQYVGLASRGALNVKRRLWAAAEDDLRQAVNVNPAEYQAYVSLAQALEKQNKLKEAMTVLDQALDQTILWAPNLPLLYQSRAELHLKCQQLAAARADFEQSIARQPKDSTSEQLVTCLVELGTILHRERKYLAALERYNRALQLKPELALTQRLRAQTLVKLNRLDEAGKALDYYFARTKAPAWDAYRERALIYAETGQRPAAIEMCTLALQQKPKDSVTRCYRGWAYLLTDAVRLALEDFDNCLREDATYVDALLGRGNARILLQQPDAALDDAAAAQKQGNLSDHLLLYKLTRIYAQVAGHLEAEARTSRPAQASLVTQRIALCKYKAIDLLAQTLEKLPPQQLAAFWRDQVQGDPALTAIRSGVLYSQLAARYAGTRP